ncbi:TPA: HAD-IA family hydrolase [Bacillus pseudomycoides]|nr:HAD-IA family hydrolase [Bacillus pseudomycoides]
MTSFKTLLFDIDDTLFDFSTWWEEGLKETLSTYPLTSQFEKNILWRTFKHYSDSLWPLYLSGKLSMDEYRKLRLIECMKEFKCIMSEVIAEDFIQTNNEISLNFLKPNYITLDILNELKKHYTIGIITNGSRSIQLEKLKRLGLLEIIHEKEIFISEHIGYEKPEPEIFHYALKYMKTSSKNTLCIGDSWELDVIGGMNLGINTIWYNPIEKAPKTEHQPFAIIKNLEMLKAILI